MIKEESQEIKDLEGNLRVMLTVTILLFSVISLLLVSYTTQTISDVNQKAQNLLNTFGYLLYFGFNLVNYCIFEWKKGGLHKYKLALKRLNKLLIINLFLITIFFLELVYLPQVVKVSLNLLLLPLAISFIINIVMFFMLVSEIYIRFLNDPNLKMDMALFNKLVLIFISLIAAIFIIWAAVMFSYKANIENAKLLISTSIIVAGFGLIAFQKSDKDSTPWWNLFLPDLKNVTKLSLISAILAFTYLIIENTTLLPLLKQLIFGVSAASLFDSIILFFLFMIFHEKDFN